MAIVQTVTGPVDGAQLGRTLVHEHIHLSVPGLELDPKRRTWDRAKIVATAVSKMRELLDAGVQTFVDPCPMELGRDPELFGEISEKSGMNIICATGFYTETIGLPAYWKARSSAEIAELYITELRDGIANTGIRPGIIKAATSHGVTESEQRVLAGAALAQRETGVAIITHTDRGGGDVQQDIFQRGGADLGRVLIGHQEGGPETAPIRKLIERGTFVGIDRIGHMLGANADLDERRADIVATLTSEGLTSNVCISQDHLCTPADWPASRTGDPQARAEAEWQQWKRPHTYILTDFVPRLLGRGVTEAMIDAMLIDNPRRLLTGA